MSERPQAPRRAVKVSDKRRGPAAPAADETGPREETPLPAGPAAPAGDGFEALSQVPGDAGEPASGTPDRAPDYLEDLRRLQAEFDNYRKRMLREQTEIAARAGSRLIERLLPVLDNFERAISHGDPDGVLELMRKELLDVLEEEGLEEIPAVRRPFDPRLHEAVDAREDESVDEPIVIEVYRTGYRLREKVLRAAMVAVVRPRDATREADDDEQSVSSAGGDA